MAQEIYIGGSSKSLKGTLFKVPVGSVEKKHLYSRGHFENRNLIKYYMGRPSFQ